MNCQTAQYLIQEYLEKELNATKRIELAQHLLECAACREEMNQMEQADIYFSRQQLFSPPESLLENIMAEVSFRQPEVEETALVQNTSKKSTRLSWYIPLSLAQIGFAAILLIAIRPSWLLPATWARFLKRVSTIGWDWFLILMKAVEGRSLKFVYLDKISFWSGIYDFLVHSSLLKLSLLFILLILTFYLNGRLLFARSHIFRKV